MFDMNIKSLIRDKKLWSWAFYDWANSTYATTVMAGFFPVFFKKFWSQGVDPVVSTANLGYVLSLTSLIVAFLAPFSGTLADTLGLKKFFCLFWAFVGSICCVALGFVPAGGWVEALWIYGISMIAFNMSLIFYDGLLPSVASGAKMNIASSIGYSLGYLGGGTLFLLNVLMYLRPESFGFKDGVQAVQLSFMSVGVWWMVFSIPMMRNVPEEKPDHRHRLGQSLKESARQILSTIGNIAKHNQNLGIFLLAYWLYIDGVYTVMTMAVDFGLGIGLQSQDLIAALLITQFVGFPCAWMFGILSRKWACKVPILVCIGVYSLAVILASQMSLALHFYLLATLIGFVQGGVQALSRSMFGRMIPHSQSGEYFGLFNLVGKFASILGPLIVAVVVQVTGSNKLGMSGLLILFVIGGGLLLKVKEPAAEG